MTAEECKKEYAEFLRDDFRFSKALQHVLKGWVFSCEHYLSNERMNRIAWLGQAAMCFETGIGKFFCGGYFLLTPDEQTHADEVALVALNQWLREHGYNELTLQQAASKTQADLY
jgi:hypothetical protein